MSKEKKQIEKAEPTSEHVTTQGIQIKVAEKVCGKCKRTLPAKDFWGSRASKDGLQGSCKDCQLDTPLGTHTTDLNTKALVDDAPTGKQFDELAKIMPTADKSHTTLFSAKKTKDEIEITAGKVGGKCVEFSEKNAPKKRVRPSRAHPIGSGKRKECAKCKFLIDSKNVSVGDGGKCLNKMAIADKENKAKACPYKE
jgi:hypothetical protein